MNVNEQHTKYEREDRNGGLEMSERRLSTIEKILHRAEDRIEEWRRQDRARKAEAEADRDKLWAEAKEREEPLTEAAREAESHRESVEAVTDRPRFVFVVHSDEEARTLETFASERSRLVKVVPVKTSPEGDTGIKGSWLVFEASG
jgi:hypothetical protein